MGNVIIETIFMSGRRAFRPADIVEADGEAEASPTASPANVFVIFDTLTAMPSKPHILTLRPVTLQDKPLFDRYLSAYPQEISELTFASIFCWTEIDHTLFCEEEGNLIVAFRDQRCVLNFFPPIGPDAVRLMAWSVPGCRRYHIARLPEPVARSVRAHSKPTFDRANSDYLYDLAELRAVQGKKYDGKRNFIRRFEKLAPEVRALRTEDFPSCIAIQEQWIESQKNNPSAVDESTALIKALAHFDYLGLHGIGVFVEKRLVGFAIGKPLNPTTFVERFEKALPDYPGVYPFLLRSFAQSIPASFTFLNREQDLGIDGLRKAKESWNPAGLVKKYTVKVRGR